MILTTYWNKNFIPKNKNGIIKLAITLLETFLLYISVEYRGGVWGVQTPPPRNFEDVGGVLDRTSKKNRRLDFLL